MSLHLRADHQGAFLRRTLKHALLVLLGAGMLMAPWYLRNYTAFGQPFFVKFHGRTFWMSAFREAKLPFTDGPATTKVLNAVTEDLPAGISIPTEPDELIRMGVQLRRSWWIHPRLAKPGSGLTSVEAEDLMFAASWESIREYPLAFAESAGWRSLQFWLTTTESGPHFRASTKEASPGELPPMRTPSRRVYFGQKNWRVQGWSSILPTFSRRMRIAAYGLTAALTLLGAGVIIYRRELRYTGVCLMLLLIYVNLVVAVTVLPLYRLRMPVDPLIWVILVCGAVTCSSGIHARRRAQQRSSS